MNTIPPSHTQIIIVGAGAVGALLALKLQQQGKQVLLIEARKPCARVTDKRTLALSYASVQTLLNAGVRLTQEDWSVIERVHVSSQDYFGCSLLRQEDLNLPYLGVVIDYARLIHACDLALIDAKVPVWWDSTVTQIQSTQNMAVAHVQTQEEQISLTANWCVLAEGGHLTENLPELKRRVFDYQQSALVATVHFSQNHQHCAFERFAKAGPLALLPYQNETSCRLIWTRTAADAQQLLIADEKVFASALAQAFGSRLGKVLAVEDKAVFPLYLKQLNQLYSGRIICIGNAAQTMHPVAAQGLNLGLRDAMVLAQCFVRPDALNHTPLARQYAKMRRLDARGIVGFTHSLITVFDRAPALLQHGRGTVLSTLNTVPFLRKKLTEYLVFGLK